ncbi:hypothetical protein OQZ33_23200 [Pedobacter sp. MC2016-05]|uniref:hypothetical protein n=1 Tax=Pedobacter sp. MC2016-05 TaxID=2994474 RepID=UPI0022450A4B|nr:hypothetical protein [Pedobacter sp. MC2016-05]MCX2477260.1 hypothetical protein [Pedobacter sp. MC2016-05]
MKKYFFQIVLMSLSYIGFAQQLTIPQVVGVPTGTQMTVSFPFDIVGVPFSEIPGAVWPNKVSASVKAEIMMAYNMEGDQKRYGNKRTLAVNIGNGGKWSITNLYIEPKPYHIPGKKMVEGKTIYRLNVYQEYMGKKSLFWYTIINRVGPPAIHNKALDQTPTTHLIPQRPITDKIPDQKLGPVKIYPKDKVILNPQPIPPKKNKTSIRIEGL